jgi:hypothetical protein
LGRYEILDDFLLSSAGLWWAPENVPRFFWSWAPAGPSRPCLPAQKTKMIISASFQDGIKKMFFGRINCFEFEGALKVDKYGKRSQKIYIYYCRIKQPMLVPETVNSLTYTHINLLKIK